MTSLGPFPVTTVLGAFAALGGAWIAVALAMRCPGVDRSEARKESGSRYMDAFLVGLLAARAGFVLRWWPEYAAAPMSILSIADGGFLWWVGLPVALAFAWWRTRRKVSLRRPVLIGMIAGTALWFAFGGVVARLQGAAPPLPDVALQTLDGAPASLRAHAGKPVVVNLWATWCPPCRREMPALADAQRRFPGVDIVLVNQGEDAAEVRYYLAGQGLLVDHVRLDAHSAVMRATGARGLPTTLFYAADGRLLDTHVGELTRAGLSDKMLRRFGQHPLDSTELETTP